MREIKVGKNDAGQRLDKFLTKALPLLPQSMLYKSIRKKRVKLSGVRLSGDYILKEGDLLALYINDEFFEEGDDGHAFMRVEPRISVVYEDENIMIVDKKPGMIVHSDDREDFGTLIDHIKSYLYKKGEYDPDLEQSFSPALCNRLDRNTGGLVIAAKNAEALRIMSEKIKRREVKKYYMCAVSGIPIKKSDTLRAWLKKDAGNNLVSVFDSEIPGSKEIITKYRVLSEKEDAALLEVDLVTGRTHQIRAHLAHVGHPLIGDGKYGSERINRTYGAKRQLLYAYKIRFEFESDAGILNYLDGRTFETEKIWFLGEF